MLNLLSVGAAYGVMVAVFQHGWGAELVGTEARRRDRVVDAAVRLRGAVRPVDGLPRLRGLPDPRGPRPRRCAPGTRSRTGIARTAGVVTSAAVIMVAVFAVFGTLSMQDMQQMGVGLAVAVLLDATVVRVVLLPAVMALLGERNWYMPKWLRWLPGLEHGEPEGGAEPRSPTASGQGTVAPYGHPGHPADPGQSDSPYAATRTR